MEDCCGPNGQYSVKRGIFYSLIGLTLLLYMLGVPVSQYIIIALAVGLIAYGAYRAGVHTIVLKYTNKPNQ